jgi:hypothetical protein
MRRLLLAVGALVLVVTAAPAEARRQAFHTPSGNIRCLYRSAGPLLRCDVLSLNDTAFTLDRRHRGKRIHVTDAVPAGRVLAYGDSLRLGPFRCRSRTSGLTCRSRPSGHGFRLSRQTQRVF